MPRVCPTLQTTDSLEARRTIYVGGLGGTIGESLLKEVFTVCGPILSIRVVDKSTGSHENIYAFIQYEDPASAEQAVELLHGRTLAFHQIKVNWAFQGSLSANARAETASHYTIFVGDLATEVNDDWLYRAFSGSASISDARVMWDMQTGRSRGYGFVSFRDRDEAERAIKAMNGARLGSRAIRTNWANLMKSTPPERDLPRIATGPGGRQELSVVDILASQEYRRISMQASEELRTVYLGNLAPDVEEADLEPLFTPSPATDATGLGDGAYVHEHGVQRSPACAHLELVNLKCFSDRGFAFATLQTHAQAALAVVLLGDVIVKGRPLKVKWQNRSQLGDGASAAGSSPLGSPTEPAHTMPQLQAAQNTASYRQARSASPHFRGHASRPSAGFASGFGDISPVLLQQHQQQQQQAYVLGSTANVGLGLGPSPHLGGVSPHTSAGAFGHGRSQSRSQPRLQLQIHTQPHGHGQGQGYGHAKSPSFSQPHMHQTHTPAQMQTQTQAHRQAHAKQASVHSATDPMLSPDLRRYERAVIGLGISSLPTTSTGGGGGGGGRW